ncbi:MAG TPA: ABC transporter permease [Ktedonobacterales bacterium]|nr:ABC transporter permease [Ktedonobacterales bacterium]
MAIKQRDAQASFQGQQGVGALRADEGIRAELLRRLAKRRANLSLFRSVKIRIGLGILGFFVLLAIFGPVFVHQDPQAFSSDVLSPPSAAHWMGTTQTGQDVFAQVIDGTRMTLLVGFAVGALATFLSVVIGLTAGYFGGVVDELISLVINVFLVIPALPLTIVLAGYIPVRGPLPVAVVISLTGWAWGARVLRAQTMSLRKREFVEAARASGESTFRIIFAEILTNELAIVASSLIFTIIYAIFSEVGLEFLGLSDVTVTSWGNMLFWATNNQALLLGAWWWIVPPGLCIALLGAGLAFTNNGIDELTNPRLRDASRG